jgi:hypothetical protein
MADRQLTFIDTDDNPFIVRLKPDRVQLLGVDSEPELEAGELRGFATALFAAYVGGPLARRLAASCEKIDRVRERLAQTGGTPELVAALDGSLLAIADIADALGAANDAIAALDEAPAAPRSTKPEYSVAKAIQKLKRSRPPRLGDGDGIRWGRARHVDRRAAPV